MNCLIKYFQKGKSPFPNNQYQTNSNEINSNLFNAFKILKKDFQIDLDERAIEEILEEIKNRGLTQK